MSYRIEEDIKILTNDSEYKQDTSNSTEINKLCEQIEKYNHIGDNQNLLARERGRNRCYNMLKTSWNDLYSAMIEHRENQKKCYTEMFAYWKTRIQ